MYVRRITDIRFSIWSQIAIGFGLCLLFFVTLPSVPLAITGIGIGLAVLFYFIKNEFSGLLLYIYINALSLIATRAEGYGLVYVITAVLTSAIVLGLIFRLSLSRKDPILVKNSQIFFYLFFIFGTCTGIAGLLLWSNSPLATLLEVSVILPFLVLPVYIYSVMELDSTREKIFRFSILVLWIILLIVNILYLKSRIASAFYLYETGRAQYDIFLNSLLLFTFISLGFCKKSTKIKLTFLIGAVLCIVGIIMCLYRTIWLTDILMLPILYLLSERKEKKDGAKFLVILLTILILSVIILFLVSPLFSLLLRNYLARFQSASQVSTDPSLVNRYIEWRGVIKAFLSSPIIGLGFGGRFFDYAWISSFSGFKTYTHNGYLNILFKTGIVGFIFFTIAYVSLIIQGIKLSRNKYLNPEHRAFARAGTVFLISLLSINITLNFLAGRDAMLWGGLVFGYFLLCEKRISKTKKELAEQL